MADEPPTKIAEAPSDSTFFATPAISSKFSESNKAKHIFLCLFQFIINIVLYPTQYNTTRILVEFNLMIVLVSI